MTVSGIPATATRYYATYAHLLTLLAVDRPKGGIADADLAGLVELAQALARAHALLDNHRIVSHTHTVEAAMRRAEDVTDGIVDAVREHETLQAELGRILVDAALILQVAAWEAGPSPDLSH